MSHVQFKTNKLGYFTYALFASLAVIALSGCGQDFSAQSLTSASTSATSQAEQVPVSVISAMNKAHAPAIERTMSVIGAKKYSSLRLPSTITPSSRSNRTPNSSTPSIPSVGGSGSQMPSMPSMGGSSGFDFSSILGMIQQAAPYLQQLPADQKAELLQQIQDAQSRLADAQQQQQIPADAQPMLKGVDDILTALSQALQ